ncbi:MAG: diguanylate cyclase [Syntrophales bacterium]|nr:diguanylate cyclase [Syntrophales bacterium]
MPKFFYSLKYHLVGIVVVTLLPALAIILYSEVERRGLDIRTANERTLVFVRGLAAEQRQITARTKQMLEMLAEVPDLKDLNAKACNDLFRAIHKQNPDYTAIYAARADGTVFACSVPFPRNWNIAGEKHFREAIRNRDLAVGDFGVGRASGLRLVNYAHPVYHPSGRLIGVVMAGFNLDHYRYQMTAEEMQKGYVFGLTDSNGVRLYRYPDTESAITGVGVPVSPTTMAHIFGPSEEGTYEGIGSDGTFRIYGHKQLRLEKASRPYMAVFAGISKEMALREAGYVRIRNLSLLGVSGLLVLALTWYFGKTTIVNRMDALILSTERIGSGVLSGRTGMSGIKGDFGRLALAFDRMTDSLEKKTQALQESEARYKQLVENATDMIVGFDVNGYYIFVNAVTLRITGYTEAEMIGRHYLDFIRPDFHRSVDEFYREQFRSRQANTYLELPLSTNDGREVWVGQNVQLILKGDRIEGLQAVSRDISERKRMEDELQRAAIIDLLTGLYNRRGFITLAKQQMLLTERSKKGLFLCFVDLDDLKKVNDEGGHEEGDKILAEAAIILGEAFRESDIIARIGGDEFAVFAIDGAAGHSHILRDRLQQQIDLHNGGADRRYKLSMSCGIAYYDPDAPCTLDELMAIADARMYAEKRAKKHC